MNPIVVSASGLATWLRCRKSYQIQYEWMRDPFRTNDAVMTGSSFHKIMEDVAKNGWVLKPRHMFDAFGDAWEMAWHYMQNHECPGSIISAENPMYTLVLPEDGKRPAMYLRTTADLVYMRSGKTIVIRDYKTFSREPSPDVDMDLQARIYCAAYQKVYPTMNIEFEYEYVRSAVPGSVRLIKSQALWTEAECYRNFVVNASDIELQALWTETSWSFQDIYETRKTERYYRNGLKGSGPHTCNSCFIKDICQKELEYGVLSTNDLDQMSTKREPLFTEEKLKNDPTPYAA